VQSSERKRAFSGWFGRAFSEISLERKGLQVAAALARSFQWLWARSCVSHLVNPTGDVDFEEVSLKKLIALAAAGILAFSISAFAQQQSTEQATEKKTEQKTETKKEESGKKMTKKHTKKTHKMTKKTKKTKKMEKKEEKKDETPKQ
jgi:outer membrane biosynthesis protein TonB